MRFGIFSVYYICSHNGTVGLSARAPYISRATGPVFTVVGLLCGGGGGGGRGAVSNIKGLGTVLSSRLYCVSSCVFSFFVVPNPL